MSDIYEHVQNTHERMISILQDHIGCLRGQLEEKQNVIDNLTLTLREYGNNIFSNFIKPMNHNEQIFSHSSNQIKIHDKLSEKKSINFANDYNTSKENISKSQESLENYSVINTEVNINRNKNTNHFPSNDTPPQSKKEKKKLTFVCGDSMVKGVEPSQIASLNDQKIVVHPHGNATSEDMLDFVKPLIRRKPDTFILHVGTNDVTNGVDTIKNIKEVNELFRKDLPNCDFVLSECTVRADRKGIANKISKLNSAIDHLATELNINVIKHTAISQRYLAKGKLHLNVKGKSLLALDFRDYLDNN